MILDERAKSDVADAAHNVHIAGPLGTVADLSFTIKFAKPVVDGCEPEPEAGEQFAREFAE